MSKKIYLLLSIIVVIIATLVSVLYFVNKNTISIKNPLVIIDTEGKQISFTKIPEKIISLIPAVTENIYDIGMGKNIIAVDTYSNFPEDTKNKVKLQTSTSLSIESITELKPDVVFMSKMGQTIEQYNNLINAGIKVVITDATSLDETYKMIELIGKVLRKENESKKITSDMKKGFLSLKNEVKDKSIKTMYFEVSPLEYGLWTAGNNTFENEIMELLNVTNVFKDVKSWSSISEEQVLVKNPQYIVTVSQDFGDFKATTEILNRSNWKNVDAIKSKNVYNINPDIMSRPTKRLLEGAKELKSIVYGD